jgi:hypothetical protein
VPRNLASSDRILLLEKDVRPQARLSGLPIRMTPAEQNIFLAINPELGIRARIVAF